MEDALFWKLSSVISPFLSAGLAAWLGFRLSGQRSRSDAFLRQRVQAVQPILTTLALVRRYCLARRGELDGNENGIALPQGAISILNLKDILHENVEAAALFLSPSEETALDPVISSMSMGASLERAAIVSEDPDILSSLVGIYRTLSEVCRDARGKMISEVRMSYGLPHE